MFAAAYRSPAISSAGGSHLEFRNFSWGQPDFSGAGILFQIFPALGLRNWHPAFAFRPHSHQRKLAWHAFALGACFHAFDQHLVPVEVFRRRPRVALRARIRSSRVSGICNCSGEKPASQWTVGNHSDSQLTHAWQDFVLHGALPERVLRLQRVMG